MGTRQEARSYWKGTVEARKRLAVTVGRNKHRSVTMARRRWVEQRGRYGHVGNHQAEGEVTVKLIQGLNAAERRGTGPCTLLSYLFPRLPWHQPAWAHQRCRSTSSLQGQTRTKATRREVAGQHLGIPMYGKTAAEAPFLTVV